MSLTNLMLSAHIVILTISEVYLQRVIVWSWPERKLNIMRMTKEEVCYLLCVWVEVEDKTKDTQEREMRISVSNSRPGKLLAGANIVGQCRRGWEGWDWGKLCDFICNVESSRDLSYHLNNSRQYDARLKGSGARSLEHVMKFYTVLSSCLPIHPCKSLSGSPKNLAKCKQNSQKSGNI